MIILRGRREKSWKEFRTRAHDWPSLPNSFRSSHAEDERFSFVQFVLQPFDVLGEFCPLVVQFFVQLFSFLETRLVHRKDSLILSDLESQPLHLLRVLIVLG